MWLKNGVGGPRVLVPRGGRGRREPLSRSLLLGVSLWPS